MSADPDENEETGILSPEHAARYDFWQKEVEKMAASGDHQNHILEVTKPYKAISILMMLEEGRPMSEITTKFHTNNNAIINIRTRHTESMKERRRHFSKLYSLGAESLAYLLIKKADRLAHDDAALDATPIKELALGVGIMTDKAAMLDGMATQHIEIRRGASLGDASKMIEDARARLAAKTVTVDAEIISPDAPVETA